MAIIMSIRIVTTTVGSTKSISIKFACPSFFWVASERLGGYTCINFGIGRTFRNVYTYNSAEVHSQNVIVVGTKSLEIQFLWRI